MRAIKKAAILAANAAKTHPVVRASNAMVGDHFCPPSWTDGLNKSQKNKVCRRLKGSILADYRQPQGPKVFAFYNTATGSSFAKNDCPSGFGGSSVPYTVPAGKYGSDLSQADANAMATADIAANGQNNANANGHCVAKNIDTAFTTAMGTGFDNTVIGIAVQPDGKILCLGTFTKFNGVTANRFTRLNANGTLDTAFNTNVGTGLNAVPSANSIKLQPDGKILIGGTFTTYNGVTVNRICRVNSDGTLDIAFNANDGLGANNSVSGGIGLSPVDGAIYLLGAFTNYDTIIACNRIVKLNAAGTPQAAFAANTGVGYPVVQSIAFGCSDGHIFIGGASGLFNNISRQRIVSLNPDGTINTFWTNATDPGFTNAVTCIVEQPDHRFVMIGSFQGWRGISNLQRIIRFNTDGSLDMPFADASGTGFGSAANWMDLQPDGKFLIVTIAPTYNGNLINRILRVNSDGTFETDLSAGMGAGANNVVTTVAYQSPNKVLIGGSFTAWDGDTNVKFFARLNG